MRKSKGFASLDPAFELQSCSLPLRVLRTGGVLPQTWPVSCGFVKFDVGVVEYLLVRSYGSVEERSVHTGKVAGSIPARTTAVTAARCLAAVFLLPSCFGRLKGASNQSWWAGNFWCPWTDYSAKRDRGPHSSARPRKGEPLVATPFPAHTAKTVRIGNRWRDRRTCRVGSSNGKCSRFSDRWQS